MATLSFQRGRGVNTFSSVSSRSLHWGSACLVCVCCNARSEKGYSNKCGLSFDPAALKHTAPPTLVLSFFPHICAVAQISLPPPTSCCYRHRTLPCTSLQIVSCLTHLETPPSTPETHLLMWSISHRLCGKMVFHKRRKCKTHTQSSSSAQMGFTSSRTAGQTSFTSPVGVILTIWRRQRGRCEECQWVGVEWSGCHGERALFHQAGLWLAAATAEGRKFCQLETIDVLLPGQAVLTQSWHLLATRLVLRFEKVTPKKTTHIYGHLCCCLDFFFLLNKVTGKESINTLI